MLPQRGHEVTISPFSFRYSPRLPRRFQPVTADQDRRLRACSRRRAGVLVPWHPAINKVSSGEIQGQPSIVDYRVPPALAPTPHIHQAQDDVGCRTASAVTAARPGRLAAPWLPVREPEPEPEMAPEFAAAANGSR
jgi:hypothetical protein